MKDEDGREWLSLHDAAARLGRSSDAVRSMIRRGRLSTRKGNDGRLLVGVPTAGDQPGDGLITNVDGHATAVDQPGDGHTTAELLHEIMELRERLAEAEGRVREAQGVALADVNAARQIAAAEVAAKDTLVAELKAMLAEARRPWWRKLLGS